LQGDGKGRKENERGQTYHYGTPEKEAGASLTICPFVSSKKKQMNRQKVADQGRKIGKKKKKIKKGPEADQRTKKKKHRGSKGAKRDPLRKKQ